MIEKTEVYRVKVTGGAFDNLKAWDYEDFDQENIAESVDDAINQPKYLAKAQAKVRFDQMCINLQKGLNALTDLKATGGDHLTVPTSMEFTLVYTQPDGLLVEITEDEYQEAEGYMKTRDGRYFKTGKKAIEALIKDAAAHTYKAFTNMWDVTPDPEGLPYATVFVKIEIPAVDGVTVKVTRLVPNYEAE